MIQTGEHLLMDIVMPAMAVTVTAVSTALLALESANQEVSELRTLLIPLCGSVVMGAMMIMFNPATETRRIVVGRSTGGLFFGALLPSSLTAIFPSIKFLLDNLAVLFLAGGIFCVLGYVMSWPFTKQLYSRAEPISGRIIEKVEGAMEAKFSVNKSEQRKEMP